MFSLSRQYPFKFFKGCLPQVLLDLLLFTSLHMLFLSESKSSLLKAYATAGLLEKKCYMVKQSPKQKLQLIVFKSCRCET